MCDKKLPQDVAEKMQQMLDLIHKQDEQIAELESRLESGGQDETDAAKFFRIYEDFIRAINGQGLIVSRKNRTEISKNYIDAPYAIYRDFIAEHLDKPQHRTFKEFLLDFQLVEAGTFEGSGLYANTKDGRTRIVRIRSDICKWIS